MAGAMQLSRYVNYIDPMQGATLRPIGVFILPCAERIPSASCDYLHTPATETREKIHSANTADTAAWALRDC